MPFSRTQWVDLGIAAATLVLALAQVLTGEASGPFGFAIASAFLFSLPLAVRWTHPWWAFGFGVGTLVLCRVTGVDLDNYLASIVAVILPLATIAVLAPVARSLIAVAIAIPVLMMTAVSGIPGLVWVSFLTLSAWAAGWLIRERRLLVIRLQQTAAELERTRERDAQTAVTAERARIARELHDVVAHSVSLMVVQAQAAERTAESDPAASIGAIRAVQDAGRESLQELRRLLGVLRPEGPEPTVRPQPGLNEVDALAQSLRAAGLDVQVRRQGTPRPLGSGVELAAYRILQEALTNVVKHADATRATVSIAYRAASLELAVRDDGSGRAGGLPGAGHGIVGMRERAALYNGTVDAGPTPGGGYLVRAELVVPEVGE